MTEKFTSAQFSRRKYTIEGDDLDKAKRIEVIVRIDGKQVVHVQCREPGMIAVVSKPAEQGIDIEIVEPIGGRFIDQQTGKGSITESIADWQATAVGV